MISHQLVAGTIQKLETWIQKGNYRGWDPFDALNSPFLRKLVGNNRRLGQVFVQLFKRSPINFRPLLNVPKGFNPKGMGLFLSTYIQKYRQNQNDSDLETALYFADWLEQNRTKTTHGIGWGYNFDWPNRGFFAPAGTPTVVNTAFIGFAFLDLYDLAQTGLLPKAHPWYGERSLAIASKASDFILKDLHVLNKDDEKICFSYTPMDQRYVHNANILGAKLLAQVAVRTKDAVLANYASSAAKFTVAHQRSNGGWAYGISKIDSWIDNFHTGYVLDGLQSIANSFNTDIFDSAISKGYKFWKDHFLPVNAGPKYYYEKMYPVDIHNISQTILTGINFYSIDPTALAYISEALDCGLTNFQDREGYFYYQKTPFYTNRIPYMRWAQAWMLSALVKLENFIEEEKEL